MSEFLAKASLQLESQHEGALQKLRQLEDSSKYKRQQEEDTTVTQAPRFSTQLNGPTELFEGQSAHYECRIEPYPDANMKVEWLHNGKALSTGHRFRTAYDFGFASLDVLTVYGEDSGEYTCRVTNRLGQAQSSVTTNIKCKCILKQHITSGFVVIIFVLFLQQNHPLFATLSMKELCKKSNI